MPPMKGLPLEFGIGVRGPKCLNDRATRWSKKFSDRFSRFDTIPAVTDTQPPSQPSSHVAVAITLNAKASSLKTRWQEVWDLAIVVNKALVSDPTVRQPGFKFGLPRRTWSLLNRFRTNTGLSAANLQKWFLTSSDKCQCGEWKTMIHIVESCPQTKFADQGLILLHEADDNAVKWLEDVATKAFTK